MADGLARYGYLPNPGSAPAGLPVGFVVARGGVDEPSLGLNRAACHTRQQIEHGGKSYRIDGGPSLADLGAFWADLDAAVGRTLNDTAKFTAFAKPCSARMNRSKAADAPAERPGVVCALPRHFRRRPTQAGQGSAVGQRPA